MSRGHGASRRRNYGRRQSEVRHRNEGDLAIDLQGPDAWPRGTGWDLNAEVRSRRANGVGLPQLNGSAAPNGNRVGLPRGLGASISAGMSAGISPVQRAAR